MRKIVTHPALRVTALLFAAQATATRAVTYFEDGARSGLLDWVDAVIPVTVWGVIWGVVTVGLVAGVWCRHTARISLWAGSSLWTLWGTSYILAWTFQDIQSRSHMTATLMFALAGFMGIVAMLTEPISTRRAWNGN